MKNIPLTAIIIRNKSVVQKEMEGKLYLMNPHEVTVHTLNDTAAFIWKALDPRRTMNQLLDLLCASYDIDRESAQRDLLSFIGMYERHGMLTIKTKK